VDVVAGEDHLNLHSQDHYPSSATWILEEYLVVAAGAPRGRRRLSSFAVATQE
jgi:hypothetical protein